MGIIETAVLALTMVGAGVSAYGAIQQGKTAKKMAEYNAKVAENEALREDMESREAIRRQRDRNRKLIGRQRAQIAKSGVQEVGSPLEVMAEDATNLELAVLDANRASLIKQQNYRQQGAVGLWEGRQQEKAGYIRAGAALIGGAGQAAGYSLYGKSGGAG